MKKKFSPALCAVFVLLAGVLWGCTGLFVSGLNEHGVVALEISEMRSAVAALVMAVILLIKDPKLFKVKIKDLWCFFGTGVISLLFFNFCYYSTIRLSGMAVAATMLYTAPVFVMLFSRPLFGESISLQKVFAVILVLCGCILVSGMLNGTDQINVPGMLYGIGAGVGYGMYSIFTRFALQRGYHSLTITTYTFIFAAAGGALFTDFGVIAKALTGTGGGTVCLLFVGNAVVTTVLAYLFYTLGLTGLDNSKASILASVEVVTATLLQIIVLGQMPDIPTLAGVILVIVAVTMLNLPEKKKLKK